MPGDINSLIRKTVFLAFLSLSPGIVMYAQNPYQENKLQNYIANNLPIDNQNWEVCLSPVNGFVYFANTAGLIEYNGITSRLFTMPLNQGLRSVYIDKNGTVFSGSYEDFGYWVNNQHGGLSYHSLTSDIKVEKNDEIWNILELNGTLYFQSFTTIYAYKNKRIEIIDPPSIMLFLFPADDGFIVQALGKGLYRFDGRKFTFIEGSQPFSTLKVHAMVSRPHHQYWICTSNDGIYNYDGKSFKPLRNELSDFLKLHTCNAGLAVSDSLLAFGTIMNGVVFSDGRGNILKNINYANGLKNNTVLSLYLDARQGLWIGLDEGANYIDLLTPFKLFEDVNGTLGTIYTIFRKEDLLYLGTNHGLFVADINNKNGSYEFGNPGIIPGTQGQVWKLYEFGGELLCGHNEGTYLVKRRSVSKISDVTGGWSFAGYNDLLLEGTYTGIVSFARDKTGNWYYRGRIEGFYQPTRFIEVDYRGYVWALHPQEGIYRLEINDRMDSVAGVLHFQSISGSKEKTTMAIMNNQLVFMTSGNMYSFDYENKKFYPLKSLQLGLGDFIRSSQIIHDERNTYWFIHENKIALFDISKSFEAHKITELVQKYTDLPGREQQIISLDRNTLLVPTRQAFTTIDRQAIYNNPEESAPVLCRLIFSGKKKNLIIIPGPGKKVSIPVKNNNLTAYIAYPEHFDQVSKAFLCRITELDGTWHPMTLDNITFLNLKSGTYHLQVRSATRDEIAQVVFTIRRHWYLSIVALILYIFALAGLTLLGMKIFRLKLERHKQFIEYEARKKKLESELDYKNYELMLTMRYLIRKTEVLKELKEQIDSLKSDASRFPVKFVRGMERIINEGLDAQTDEWKSTMNNLKLSQEGFFRKLKARYPDLTPNDLRLCSYLRMNFSTKEMAHLLNISGRAVEIGRYRLRRKMHLDHDINLTEFLISEVEKE